MVLRTGAGACAGALAGLGFALTADWHRQYCYLKPGRTGCGDSSPLLLPPIFGFWMLVAGVVIYLGFRLARAERGWWATGLGSGLWFVLIVGVVWFKTLFLDMVQEDGHLFLMQAAVIVSCVAYAAAALFVGRARTC
jgi:hypothetical protein